MDVILHLGAHRTATTALQGALRAEASRLAAEGLAVWTPQETRGGLLAGVVPEPGLASPAAQLRRARGRIALAIGRLESAGMTRLLVSDENLPGTPRGNIKARALYPAAGFRLARQAQAFGPRLVAAHLTIRALDSYWASLMAYALLRGGPVLGPAALAAIATNPRGWRDVITDIACALPDVPLAITVYDDCPDPGPRLTAMTGDQVRLTGSIAPVNVTPDLPALRCALQDAGGHPADLGQGTGRWQPFGADHAAQLRETWADDLFWLRAGADGLARLITDTNGATDPFTLTRGHQDDEREGCVA